MIDSGYAQTIRLLPEILNRVERRVSENEREAARKKFLDKVFPVYVDDITFTGFNQGQRNYLRRLFRFHPKKDSLSMDQIKRGYFRLVSEDYFQNIYPNFLFKEDSKTFDFNITRRPQQNFQVDFGGTIASRSISHLFLGLNFYSFNNILSHTYLSFQSGEFIKSATAKTRIQFPLYIPFYLEPEFNVTQRDYFSAKDLLIGKIRSTVLKRSDRNFSLHAGWPLGQKRKLVLNATFFDDTDRYSNALVYVSTDTLDILKLRGLKTGFEISRNSLNRKQYASSGSSFSFSGYYYNAREIHLHGNTPNTTLNSQQESRAQHQWYRFQLKSEKYFPVNWFKAGYLLEGVFSNQDVFSNYMGTLINIPGFYPLQDSRTLVLQNFRALQYGVIGLRNVFGLAQKLDFRLEGYLFMPFQYLQKEKEMARVVTGGFQAYLAATGNLVFHSPIGPISLSINYYDDPENRLGVLLHAGFLLFKPHPLGN